MKLVYGGVLVCLSVVLPSLAGASGEWSVGEGYDRGLIGVTREFKLEGMRVTPQVGLGLGGASVGANYYFTEKQKGEMPAGARAQVTGGIWWSGATTVTVTGGQRTGNWDWGVGLVYASRKISGFGTAKAIGPAVQWGFRF